MTELQRPQPFPEGVVPFLAEIAKILGVQQHALSVGGISGDRHWLGKVHDLSMDTLRLMVDYEEKLYQRNDGYIDPYGYYENVRERLIQGSLKPPTFKAHTSIKPFIQSLKVVYLWAEDRATLIPDMAIGPWSDMIVGQPIGIISQMLDPLVVNRAQVDKLWTRLKGNERAFERFFRNFELDVKFTLHPIKLDL